MTKWFWAWAEARALVPQRVHNAMYGTNHNLVDKYIDKTNFAIHWILIYPLNIVHLMYGPEGNSFDFSRVLMFPEMKSRETSGLKGKQN